MCLCDAIKGVQFFFSIRIEMGTTHPKINVKQMNFEGR